MTGCGRSNIIATTKSITVPHLHQYQAWDTFSNLVYLYSHNFNIYFVDSERAWNSDYLLSPTDQTAPRSRACSSAARRSWRSRSPCSGRGGSGGGGGSPGTACRTARPATCTARTRGRGTCPPPAGRACCGPRRGPGASTPRRASGRTPPPAPRAAAGPW